MPNDVELEGRIIHAARRLVYTLSGREMSAVVLNLGLTGLLGGFRSALRHHYSAGLGDEAKEASGRDSLWTAETAGTGTAFSHRGYL